jgi:hypothetical protein
METINTLRVLLVAGAVLAAVVAAAYGQWVAVVLLVAGIAGHMALWVHLHRVRQAPTPPPPPSAG